MGNSNNIRLRWSRNIFLLHSYKHPVPPGPALEQHTVTPLPGLAVVGVDISGVALEKAKRLAESCGVEIKTLVADLGTFEPEENHYGSVISISAHLPSRIRNRLYPLIERSLKRDGVVILEAFSENQLSRSTGGPKDADMLMTVEKLQREFPNLEPVLLREVEREVSEGAGHTGIASVVQFYWEKGLTTRCLTRHLDVEMIYVIFIACCERHGISF